MLSLAAGLVMTISALTCHPISCDKALEEYLPVWADTFTMAGILQGEVGNIPAAYDFVAEQLVADALDYHVIGKPLVSRWFAWKKPSPEATQAILNAWQRMYERDWKMTVPRCDYVISATDAKRLGFALADANWEKHAGRWAVYAYACN